MSKRKNNRLAPIVEMLLAEDKWISKPSGPKGILARLWRRILINMNVKPSQFSALMNEFIMDSRNGVPDNQKLQTSMRGNLTKEFLRNRMTWPVFLKGLRFLKFRKIRFIVQVYHDTGNVTEHFTDVDLGGREDLNHFLSDMEEEEELGEHDNDQTSEASDKPRN